MRHTVLIDAKKNKSAKTKAMKIVLALDFSICAMFRLVFVLWASKRKKKNKRELLKPRRTHLQVLRWHISSLLFVGFYPKQ